MSSPPTTPTSKPAKARIRKSFRGAWGIAASVAKAISTVVATAVSYVGNRLWSFAHRVSDSGAQRRDLTVYAAINIVGLVITLVPVGVTHYLLDLTGQIALNVAAIIGTAFATVFRFLAYRRWVFVGNPDAAERAALV